jgi:hypothetical protein
VKRCAYAGPAAIATCLAVMMFVGTSAPGASPYECSASLASTSRVDQIVFRKLQNLNIAPARLCSDPVFVRRVYLDVTGSLPSAFEARCFILDRDPIKRSELIQRLLEEDAFADYLAMKWSDVLRIKAEFPINLWPNAAQAYHRWVRQAMRENRPYDQFARQLLTASGGNFDNPPVNFYRAMQNRSPAGIAQAAALTFLGQRADRWRSNQLSNLSVFFANVGYKSTAEWKEEIVIFTPASTNTGALNGSQRSAELPDGSTVTLSPDRDPREVLAEWLVRQPQFARALVNRVWSWLLGRGIVEEPDDFRPDNPPTDPELLAYLERDFVDSGFNLKRLYGLILNSETYQLSSIPQSPSLEAAANFASYPLRRLEAEVLIDAIDQITGTNENYSSSTPEPYTFIPETLKSVALPDGSITSSFLETFGRPPRDTGLESERNNRVSPSQKLFLLNSGQMQRKLASSRMIEFQTSTNRSASEIARGMYLGILSRFPTQAETQVAEAYFQSGIGKRQAAIDLAWALMNTAEFLYRH